LDAGGGAMVSAVHYDSNTYIVEKRRALEIWNGVLASIVKPDHQIEQSAHTGQTGQMELKAHQAGV